MYTLVLVLFTIISFFLVVFVLIQQGKSDLGVSNTSGSHLLFGGSGGQTFLERITWALGALFITGALALSVLKSKDLHTSILDGVVLPVKEQATNDAAKNTSVPLEMGNEEEESQS
jgi:protein translocase SecG subunit